VPWCAWVKDSARPGESDKELLVNLSKSKTLFAPPPPPVMLAEVVRLAEAWSLV